MDYSKPEASRASWRRYAATDQGRLARKKANRNYRTRNQEKIKAHYVLHRALKSGEVVQWPGCCVAGCECTTVEAHHADYGRPLDVTWLCDLHHKAVHTMQRQLSKEH